MSEPLARLGLRREAQRHAAVARTEIALGSQDFLPPESGVAAALCHRSPRRRWLKCAPSWFCFVGNFHAANLRFAGEFNLQKLSAADFVSVKHGWRPVAILACAVEINFLLRDDFMKIFSIRRDGKFHVALRFREECEHAEALDGVGQFVSQRVAYNAGGAMRVFLGRTAIAVRNFPSARV